ncbi:hypothetical protein B0J18DRAFT_406053 [Chaetomium sp. MPI-SDFR-AT-0129]|nr:hypothetical protein B0J18DRAFT_406053 [Chaetomium sp. MPI-SDFR-AT-0129]
MKTTLLTLLLAPLAIHAADIARVLPNKPADQLAAAGLKPSDAHAPQAEIAEGASSGGKTLDSAAIYCPGDYPYLCPFQGGFCCQFNICCENQCCLPGTRFCSNGGCYA